MRYRKKPVVIEAVQLSWRTWSDLCALMGDAISDGNPGRFDCRTSSATVCPVTGEEGPLMELTIPTLEGPLVARHGEARPGGAKRGRAWHGMARQGAVWPGKAWLGTAGPGEARQGWAWRGEARRGKARFSQP